MHDPTYMTFWKRQHYREMPGSCPSGSRKFEVETARKTYLFRNIKERLGKNSVVGNLVEKRG